MYWGHDVRNLGRLLACAGAASLAVAFAAQPVMAQIVDANVQVGVGVDYSSGDYGEAVDTDMLAVPVSARVKLAAFTLRASVPWIRIDGPPGVIPGDGGTVGGGGGAAVSRSGIGDANLSATVSLPAGIGTSFDITGKVKLPTADETKGLGTGTTDYTLQGELLQSLGPATVAVRGGRRFNGSNALYPLNDVWLAGAGAYVQIGDTSLGLDYDWREGSLPTSFNRREITGSITQRLSSGLRLQGYVYTGLSDGSPDLGGGAQVLFRFGM
jgi:hypothetical protein